MKTNIILSFSVLVMLVGCGKSNKSSNNNSGFDRSAGVCSQNTTNLYYDLLRKSEGKIKNENRVNEIHRSCKNLEQALSGSSCQDPTASGQSVKFISYSEVSNYCAEVEAYVSQDSPSRGSGRPVPLPGETNPVPNPPKYNDNVLLAKMNSQYALHFKKSSLSPKEMDYRVAQTRCKLSLTDRSNDRLNQARGKFVSAAIQIYPGGADYALTLQMSHTGELFKLNCRSNNQKLTVKEVNKVLSQVAVIR